MFLSSFYLAYEYFPDSEIASVTVATSTLLTTRSESEEDLLEKEVRSLKNNMQMFFN